MSLVTTGHFLSLADFPWDNKTVRLIDNFVKAVNSIIQMYSKWALPRYELVIGSDISDADRYANLIVINELFGKRVWAFAHAIEVILF